jgi:hypothetical protein
MTRALQAAGIAVILLVAAQPIGARQPPATPEQTSQAKPQAPPHAQTPPPSAESMGVSLKNIRRQVPEASVSQQPAGSGLRYDFFVDVFGKRPAIDFFKDFDLSTKGSIRWGGVTHQEILNAVTPYPFHIYTGGIELLGGTKK